MTSNIDAPADTGRSLPLFRLQADELDGVLKGPFLSRDGDTGDDPFSGKPALLHLQHVKDTSGVGVNGCFIQWPEVVKFEDPSVNVDVGDGERDPCILH